jgi:competence ComEA-like helix-hairpin-helix protein
MSAPEETGRGELRIRCPLLWVALLVVALLAVMLAGRPLWNSWPQSDVTAYFAAVQTDGRIDLNRADTAALCTLPGIGKSRAAAILAWRQAHGGFTAVEELLQISGIGEEALKELRKHVCVLPPEETSG